MNKYDYLLWKVSSAELNILVSTELNILLPPELAKKQAIEDNMKWNWKMNKVGMFTSF